MALLQLDDCAYAHGRVWSVYACSSVQVASSSNRFKYIPCNEEHSRSIDANATAANGEILQLQGTKNTINTVRFLAGICVVCTCPVLAQHGVGNKRASSHAWSAEYVICATAHATVHPFAFIACDRITNVQRSTTWRSIDATDMSCSSKCFSLTKRFQPTWSYKRWLQSHRPLLHLLHHYPRGGCCLHVAQVLLPRLLHLRCQRQLV